MWRQLIYQSFFFTIEKRKLLDLIKIYQISLISFSDAQILYNKKPKPKKRYTKKAKLESKSNLSSDMDTIRKKKQKIRKGLATLDESVTSLTTSTSMSSLASMSIDEISSARDALELDIEYSQIAKEVRRDVLLQREKTGRDVVVNAEVKYKDLVRLKQTVLLLNEKTLIYILYCALNICGSKIQLGDLLRFTRESLISFYNFTKHLPEDHNKQLSLTKGQSFAFNKFATIRMLLPKFVAIIPDLDGSFTLPNMPQLVRRYLKELSLPEDLGDFIERLINFMPPNMKSDASKYIPNYEARAVAYILFVLKLLFGIDGYREVEISKSAKKFNNQLKKEGIGSFLFVFEDWREFIAYRDIILSKYYCPYILNRQYEGDTPYASFLAMLEQVQQEILIKKKKNFHFFEKKRQEKFANTQNLANKLLAMHNKNEINEEEAFYSTNEISFTPLHDAFKAIIESSLGSKLNAKIIKSNHRFTTCTYFLKPKSLMNLFKFDIRIKKCIFPKNFTFKKAAVKENKIKFYKVVHDGVTQKAWMEEKKVKPKEDQLAYHQLNYEKILAKRAAIQQEIKDIRSKRQKAKSRIKHEENFFEYLFDDGNKNKLKPQDEIADLNEFDAMFGNTRECRNITFVTPDFNLWHVNAPVIDYTSSSLEEIFPKLPKKFRWLLAVASSTINQSESDVYRQLVIIEREFIKLKSIELLDAQPRGTGTYW